MDADRATRKASAHCPGQMRGHFNTLRKPVRGRVHGNAFGGRVGLCCSCDIVFADKAAKFGLTENELGLIPATIGPFVTKRMGEEATLKIFLPSRTIDAVRAPGHGIVSQICTAKELDALVEAEFQAFLACSPIAIADA